jgi:hypothetical protein
VRKRLLFAGVLAAALTAVAGVAFVMRHTPPGTRVVVRGSAWELWSGGDGSLLLATVGPDLEQGWFLSRIDAQGKVNWTIPQAGAPYYVQALYAADGAYFVFDGGAGTVQWVSPAGTARRISAEAYELLAADARRALCRMDNQVACYDTQGHLLWSKAVNSVEKPYAVQARFQSDGDTVAVGSAGVFRLGPDGRERWHIPEPGYDLAEWEDTVVVLHGARQGGTALNSAQLSRYSAAGTLRWTSAPFPGGDLHLLGAAGDSLFLASYCAECGSYDRRVLCFDTFGSLRWRTEDCLVTPSAQGRGLGFLCRTEMDAFVEIDSQGVHAISTPPASYGRPWRMVSQPRTLAVYARPLFGRTCLTLRSLDDM